MKRKILIYVGHSLFPKIMASQDRIINMIIELSKDHSVDLAMVYRSMDELRETTQKTAPYLTNLYPIKAVNFKSNHIKRKYFGIKNKLLSKFSGLPSVFYSINNEKYKKEVHRILDKNNYDVFQVEYWYFSDMFSEIKHRVLKVIDLHMIAFDDLYGYCVEKYGKDDIPPGKLKEIARIKQKELNLLKNADLLLPISINDSKRLVELSVLTRQSVIPTGQNINYFTDFGDKQKEKTIIFYGSMGGMQNILAFNRFWTNIYPIVIKAESQIKLIVIGANPTEEIKKLENLHENITVTGYVNDVRDYISKGKVLVLPLEVGVGFRSRIVEVMAMGVPVVGTHNALDNTEMQHGVHGFISDSDVEMAKYLLEVLNNDSLHKEMSGKCKEFVKDRYSIEATFGKLSSIYNNI